MAPLLVASNTLVILPFQPISEGETLTITCATTNGAGAALIDVVNENNNVYTELMIMLDPSNVTVGRFEFGPVSRSDSGKRFKCRSAFDGSESVEQILEVVCKSIYVK